MAPPAAPLYRITPLRPDRNANAQQSAPIEVARHHVPMVCQALRRAGIRRVRLQQVTDQLEMLDMLADRNLPALMRRQVL